MVIMTVLTICNLFALIAMRKQIHIAERIEEKEGEYIDWKIIIMENKNGKLRGCGVTW